MMMMDNEINADYPTMRQEPIQHEVPLDYSGYAYEWFEPLDENSWFSLVFANRLADCCSSSNDPTNDTFQNSSVRPVSSCDSNNNSNFYAHQVGPMDLSMQSGEHFSFMQFEENAESPDVALPTSNASIGDIETRKSVIVTEKRSFQESLNEALLKCRRVELEYASTDKPVLQLKYSKHCAHCQKKCPSTQRNHCPHCERLNCCVYVCSVCSVRQFTAYSRFIGHLRWRCDPCAKYHCAYCEYRTSQQGELRKHVKARHVDVVLTGQERSFGCGWCERVFAEYGLLEMHQRRYCAKYAPSSSSSDEVDECSAAARAVDLSDEVLMGKFNSGEYSYSVVCQLLLRKYCDTCRNLRPHDHRLLPSNKQSCYNCNSSMLWNCRRCGSSYASYSSYGNHLRKRCLLRRASVVKCEECDYETTRASHMARHCQRKHRVDVTSL